MQVTHHCPTCQAYLGTEPLRTPAQCYMAGHAISALVRQDDLFDMRPGASGRNGE